MTLEDVELRHLPTGSLHIVATTLEINNDWKKVMSLIPINPESEDFAAKYNNDQIKQIEDHARATNKTCAEVLFEEWGSSGRIRPTLKTLQTVLQKAEILRAADDVAKMLGEPRAKRPTTGPAAPIPLDITAIIMKHMEKNVQPIGNSTNLPMESEGLSNDLRARAQSVSMSSRDVPNISEIKDMRSSAKTKSENDLTEYSHELDKNYESKFKPHIRNIISDSTDSKEAINQIFPKIEINPEIINNSELEIFTYQELARITDNFAVDFVGPNSKYGKIGSGGFADVYLGYHHNYGRVAVKKPKPNREYKTEPEIFNDIFNSEIRFLSLFKHTNIVQIIGYSIDGSSPCIVCEYIEGGTLEKKLEEKILNEKERINILIGTAEAIKFFHSSKTANITRSILAETGSKIQQNFSHGDLKTANILLTKDYVPKLCDFAAGKQYDNTSCVMNQIVTLSYMAPEQVLGTTTQETDIYHYGIILLEVLTGLKSIVRTTTGDLNIKDYIEENCPKDEINIIIINNCLDSTIKTWTKGTELYLLAKSCLQERKLRPSAADICRTLYNIAQD